MLSTSLTDVGGYQHGGNGEGIFPFITFGTERDDVMALIRIKGFYYMSAIFCFVRAVVSGAKFNFHCQAGKFFPVLQPCSTGTGQTACAMEIFYDHKSPLNKLSEEQEMY